MSRRTQDGFSGTATRKPAATASSQLLSNPNIIPDQQTGLSVAIHNGQMWSHNQSFNNGAMPSAGMAPCNPQFAASAGAYQNFDMDIDHAPTPPPAFGTVRNPNSQPPAYMSQTIQQSTTTTYGMPAYAKGTNNPAGPPQGMPDVEMEHWIQHQQFPSHVVDSGFHTALSSQTPSLYEPGEMDGSQLLKHNYYDVPVNTPLAGVSTPHLIEEQSAVPAATPSLPGTQSALTSAQLSHLMESIMDDDEFVAKKAMAMLYDLSKKRENEDVFSQKLAYILTGIIMATQKSQSAEFLSDATGCFYNFCERRENIKAILANNSIAFLVHCLIKPLRGVQNYVVSAFYTLFSTTERSPSQPDLDRQAELKKQIIEAGGVEALLPLLMSDLSGREKDGPRRIILASNCLKELALKNPAVKKTIVRGEGHSMLLKIMDTPQPIDGKVLLHASEALKAVSSDEECKKAIIAFKYFRVTREIDGIGVLIECHNTTDKYGDAKHKNSTMVNILYTLSNLSDVLAQDPNLASYDVTPLSFLSIPLLDKRLTNGQVHPRALCAAHILRNLSCAPHCREPIYSLWEGAIVTCLLKILRDFPTHQGMTEAAVNTLKHLTYKHNLSQHAVSQIGSLEHGIEVIQGILGQKGYWDTIKGTLGLITNLAVDATNRVLLRNAGVLNLLFDKLHVSHAMMFPAAEQTKSQKSPDNILMPVEKGASPVKTIDILRGTIECLDGLMDDHGVLELMLQCVREQGRSNSGLYAIFYQLLQYHFTQDGYRGSIRRIITDVLGKMTASVDGSNLVKSFAPELLEVLQALSQLPPGPPGNQSVAQNAKKAVYNMTADRTSENFQQVQQQMMQQPAPSVSDFDGFGYSYHQYAASGPPSMHGSTFGSVMSVANSDILSDFDPPVQNFRPHAGPSQGRNWSEQTGLQPGQEYPSNTYGAQPQQHYQQRSGTSTPLQMSTASRGYRTGNAGAQSHQMQ